jgi:hypothetical protein
VLTDILHWLRLKTGVVTTRQRARVPSFEPLEPRVLLSADLAGVQLVLASEAVPADPAIYVDLNDLTQGDEASASADALPMAAPGAPAGTQGQPTVGGPSTVYSGGSDRSLVKLGDPADTTLPTIGSFSVSPSSVPLGGSFLFTYTVSDSGGSGLNSVELWRTDNPDVWPSPPVAQNSATGDGPVTGYLSNVPPSEGDWWYRIRVFDAAGNSITQALPAQVVVNPPDTTAPSPDPSAWAVVPHATSSTSMQMVAMTATDVSGVEYYFHEISGNPGATDSGWHDSDTYEDTGLFPGTTYIYEVKSRDKSPNHNETAYSDLRSAMTDADTTPPSPDPSTWATEPYATGSTSIRMVATVATDPSDVEYYFRETGGNPGATDSGWQASNVYENTGLSPSTTYTYQVRARDKSPNQNETQPSEARFATTEADTAAPSPNPSTWAAAPHATGATAVTMVATVATDVSGVEYYFDEISGNPGATDSGWQDSNVYEDTGLFLNTLYIYQVKTRDRSVNHNEGAYSASASVVTPSPVYRFWSPVLQRHFYTIRESEKNKLINNYRELWVFEGVAYYAFAGATDASAAPIYRFWSGTLQAHFFTMRQTERDKLIRNDYYRSIWTYEGVAFYAYAVSAPPVGTSAVYRFWSSTFSVHFYTMRLAERDKLINDPLHLWTYEQAAWYAYQA